MAKQEPIQPTVSRTFRAAVRIGEDFYTVEETVTLPIAASDEEIAQAVALGERIYRAQRAAADTQVRELRDQQPTAAPIQIRDPEAPASDKQRQYMDYLVTELGWDGQRLQQFASERKLDILVLTKREASELIDELKGLVERRSTPPTTPVEVVAGHASRDEHATPRQVKALERLADERGIDVAAELAASYDGRPLSSLTLDEAGQLLTEWQQRPRLLRPRLEIARRAA